MNNKKIAMIVFSHYPEDPRVRREAEALDEAGYHIDIFCLKREKKQKKKETYSNIRVYRSSLMRSRTGKLSYLIEYFIFIMTMFFRTTAAFIRNGYSVMHIHNMPDVLVFIPLIPKIFGARIILDLHDPTPEVFIAKYNMDQNNRFIRILTFLEKISIGFADKVLTPNKAFRDLFVSRGCQEKKIEIVMNSPHEAIFRKELIESGERTAGKPFSLIYHGSIVKRHGLTDALGAVKILRMKIPNIRFDIYGNGDYNDNLKSEILDFGLSDIVFFHGFEYQDKLVYKILEADVGLIPNRINPFTEINLPTRIFEYLIMEKPVIAPNTRGIRDYFDNESLLYFKSGDPADLADVIYKVYTDKKHCNDIVQKGISVYNKYTWQSQKQILLGVYNSILAEGRGNKKKL